MQHNRCLFAVLVFGMPSPAAMAQLSETTPNFDLAGNLDDFVDGQELAREVLVETDAFDQLEYQKSDSIGFFEAIDGSDVLMLKRGDDPRFALEAKQAPRILGEFGRQHFDRHVPPQAEVVGPIDLAHATLADKS